MLTGEGSKRGAITTIKRTEKKEEELSYI